MNGFTQPGDDGRTGEFPAPSYTLPPRPPGPGVGPTRSPMPAVGPSRPSATAPVTGVAPPLPTPTAFTTIVAGGFGAIFAFIGLVLMLGANSSDVFDSRRGVTSDGTALLGLILLGLGLVIFIMAIRSMSIHQRTLRPETGEDELPPFILLVGLFFAAAILIVAIVGGAMAFIGMTFNNVEFASDGDDSGKALLVMIVAVLGFVACVAAARGANWGRIVIIVETSALLIGVLNQMSDVEMDAAAFLVLAWFATIIISLVVPATNRYLTSGGGGPVREGHAPTVRSPGAF